MKKNYKNQKGISLLSLSIAIIVLLVIVGTVLFNVRSNLGLQRVKSMQADIENLRGKVANYYLQYGSLPILNRYEGNIKRETKIDSSVISDVVENASNNLLDTGDYYIIDLKAMDNITLTYGEDYEKLKDETVENIQNLKNGTLTDVYIINSVSHNIFYVPGITYDGKTYYTQYQDEEKEKIGESNFDIDLESRVEKDSKGNLLYRVDKGERAPANRNAIYIDEDDNQAIIPAGFTVSKEDDEDSIENGLVVKDENENEWVWIPVSSDDLEKMYVEDSSGWKLSGTNMYTKLKTRSLTEEEEIASQKTLRLGTRELERTSPGVTDNANYREPDVLTGYDKNQTYRSQAGFSNLEDMATKLKDDYKDMIYSIRDNGGFYIGRYELGKDENGDPQEKSGDVMNAINWYNAYSRCKSFSIGKVQARMIWGCQWDQVCRFISTAKDVNGNTISLDNSASYGNYSSSSDLKTGTRSYCITKNIYDLAGNCWEWTQEAHLPSYRARRGR